jgi:hypothetical protein
MIWIQSQFLAAIDETVIREAAEIKIETNHKIVKEIIKDFLCTTDKNSSDANNSV